MIQSPPPARGQGSNETTAGGNQPPEFERGAGAGMVTDMVKVRKLTWDILANFPDPSARACAANKGVSQESVRFRAFLRVQKWGRIVQDRAESCKNVDKNVQKTTENTPIWRPRLFKRVKSRGSCQAETGEPPRLNHFWGFRRTTEMRRGQSADSAVVDGKSTGENRRGPAQSKGLVSCVSAEGGCGSSGFVRRPKSWEVQPVDFAIVVSRSAEESRRTSAPSKGLANLVSSEP